MPGFDPKNNIADKQWLASKMEEFWANVFTKIQKQHGTIEINGKKYDFFGWGPWLQPWVTWFDRKMAEINDDIMGYSKKKRWDVVGEKILKWKQQPAAMLPSAANMVQELFMVMEKPDKEPVDPDKLTAEMDKIYGTLHKQVIKRLMPEADIKIEQVPIVFDKIKEHVVTQQMMAINFLDYSEDLSGIISGPLQALETKEQVNTSV